MAFATLLRIRVGALCGRPAALLARAEALHADGSAWAAFPLFVRAARAGLAEAQRRVGECYLMGQGVPPNLAEALRWLTRAADAGDVPAQTQLASLALRGARAPPAGSLFPGDPGDTPDFDAAKHWSRRAANAGSADATALLGLVLTVGPEAQRDPAAGRTCYRRAAEAGSPRGRLALAMALLADGRADAAQEARALLHDAAGDRIPSARFLEGALAESGAAGTIDYETAARAYQCAAEQGHVAAQFRYGLALLAGRGVARDPFTAETWLRRAAMGGVVQAAAAIGDLYAQPEAGQPPNYEEAAAWYQRAADAGHAGAARQLGRAYLQGQGVPKDVQLALHWLRAAIRGGEEMAQVDMAPLSLSRLSNADDQRETAAWFQRLAQGGNMAAVYNLGVCLADGIGTACDPAAARDCFRRAADVVPAARIRLFQMAASTGA